MLVSKKNISKFVILLFSLIGLVLVGGFTVVGSLLFWSGGFFILPGIILFISFKSFEGNKIEKFILSILPWLVLLSVNHIYIRDSADPLSGLVNEMIVISLFLGTLLAFNKKKATSVDIAQNENNLQNTSIPPNGKEILLLFSSIAGLFIIILVGSWIYYFLSQLF